METRQKLVRWLRLVTAAIAAELAILALMILPDLVGFLPCAIPGSPLEWSAVALVVVFRKAIAFVAARRVDDPAAARVRRFLDRLDAGSRWALEGGLVLALALFSTGMLASWAPHYLTWPWCRDEDTFATLAQSWDAGIRPYRDIRAYNFPGHIYLHWLIGRALGWGHTVPFYALDVAAILALGAALTVWSRRLGGSLPGLVGYVTFLGFYLSQDYEQVAERDWHATLGAALALMALEVWSGRPSLWIAAALEAAALTIRPHAVFFLPAIGSAIAERPRPGRDVAEWGIAVVLFASLGFAPLVAQGLLDDLLRGLRVAAYGGPYSKASLAGALTILGGELRSPWTFALVASLCSALAFRPPDQSHAGADMASRARRRALLSNGAPGPAQVPGESAGLDRLDCPGPPDGAGCVDVLARPAIAGPGRHADPLRGDTAHSHFLCPTRQRPRTRRARSRRRA
jgi:hypothetical protein